MIVRVARWQMAPILLLASQLTLLAADKAPVTREGAIESISTDHTELMARDTTGPFALWIEDKAIQDSLVNWHKGDHVRFTITGTDPHLVMKGIAAQTVALGAFTRILAMCAACAIMIIAAFIMTGLKGANLRQLLFVGQDNRYSNSKCQISLWFGALIISYLSVLFLRRWYGGPDFLGNVNIPAHLLGITGLSAFTFGTAKAITQSKVDDAKQSAAKATVRAAAVVAQAVADAPADEHANVVAAIRVPVKSDADTPRFPLDLLMDDHGNFDFGDFQMIVITFISLAVYLWQVFDVLGALPLQSQVTLPDVDTTILATFGLGAGAYLGKKAAGSLGQ